MAVASESESFSVIEKSNSPHNYRINQPFDDCFGGKISEPWKI
jgi:hypothetical protein